jgi:hypothetical protein
VEQTENRRLIEKARFPEKDRDPAFCKRVRQALCKMQFLSRLKYREFDLKISQLTPMKFLTRRLAKGWRT